MTRVCYCKGTKTFPERMLWNTIAIIAVIIGPILYFPEFLGDVTPSHAVTEGCIMLGRNLRLACEHVSTRSHHIFHEHLLYILAIASQK